VVEIIVAVIPEKGNIFPKRCHLYEPSYRKFSEITKIIEHWL